MKKYHTQVFTLFEEEKNQHRLWDDQSRDGNGVRQGRRMGSLPPPSIILSYPIPAPPRPAWQEKFSYPFPPFKAPRNLTPPRKTLHLIDLPTAITIFLIKHVSLIKIYLKLQLNLSYQIKLFFSKNYIILFECIFNKIISQQKWKYHNITHNKIEIESHVRENKIS